MRAANINQVKRRVLQEAVAENLDTIRGLPPRAIRPGNRLAAAVAAPRAVPARPADARRVDVHDDDHAAATRAGDEDRSSGDGQPRVRCCTPPRPRRRPSASRRRRSRSRSAASSSTPVTAAPIPAPPRRSCSRKRSRSTSAGVCRRCSSSDGFEVVATRDADRTIALRERARLANESRSDIFLSIHVNALIKHTEARGIETYFLGATNDPKLTQLAAAENRVSGYSIADMRALLDGVYADARRDESHELAKAVQKQLFTTLRKSDPGLENWGVKRAPFLVLVATDMPAVLAEVGCISNEKEAAMLRRPEYRQKIADALFHGIRGYANERERKEHMAEVLHVGIDLGTSRSAISASNGERFVVDSFVGWPLDMVAKKVLKRDVLIGHEAVANRTMLDLHRPLERGLLKEGSEKDVEAVRELLQAPAAARRRERQDRRRRTCAPWSAFRPRRCGRTSSTCATR